MFEKFPDVLTIEDIQKALGMGRSKIYRLVSSGEIKHWKIGKSIRIPKPFLMDYLSSTCYNDGIQTDPPSEGGLLNDGESL